MKKGKLLILSAPSGAGKTTILKEIMKENRYKMEFSVSACNRPPRKGEIHGKDYYFLTDEEFKDKISAGEFLEWEEVYEGRYYGTLKSEVERIRDKGHNVGFDIDVVGGLNIKKFFADDALSVFIEPPSLDELEKRLKNRGTEDHESLKMRINKARHEMSYAGKFDFVVVNNNLDQAVSSIRKKLDAFLI
jgi:guanylate kinase